MLENYWQVFTSNYSINFSDLDHIILSPKIEFQNNNNNDPVLYKRKYKTPCSNHPQLVAFFLIKKRGGCNYLHTKINKYNISDNLYNYSYFLCINGISNLIKLSPSFIK